MLQKAYLLAKIGADTAENEQHFAEILPIGRRVADRPGGGRHATPSRGERASVPNVRVRLHLLQERQRRSHLTCGYSI